MSCLKQSVDLLSTQRGTAAGACHSTLIILYLLSTLYIYIYVTELYDQTNRPETLEVEPEEEVDTDEKIFYKVRWKIYQGNEEQKGYRR